MNKDQTFFTKYTIRVENLPGEDWRQIDGFDFYAVSNMGRIKRLFRESEEYAIIKGKQTTRIYYYEERLVTPFLNKDGYYVVTLIGLDGKKHSLRVNRLVAIAFVANPDPENQTQVNHLNEILTDNRAENLAWATPKENANWATRNIRVSKKLTGKKYGKYSDERRKAISAGVLAWGKNCKKVIAGDKTFKSAKAAAAYFGVNVHYLRKLLRGAKKMPKAYQDLNLRYAESEAVK